MGTKNYKGSRWWKIDFHTHTPSSCDYLEKQVTEAEWVDAAIAKGLDAVVVTDHNSGEWVDQIERV